MYALVINRNDTHMAFDGKDVNGNPITHPNQPVDPNPIRPSVEDAGLAHPQGTPHGPVFSNGDPVHDIAPEDAVLVRPENPNSFGDGNSTTTYEKDNLQDISEHTKDLEKGQHRGEGNHTVDGETPAVVPADDEK